MRKWDGKTPIGRASRRACTWPRSGVLVFAHAAAGVGRWRIHDAFQRTDDPIFQQSGYEYTPAECRTNPSKSPHTSNPQRNARKTHAPSPAHRTGGEFYTFQFESITSTCTPVQSESITAFAQSQNESSGGFGLLTRSDGPAPYKTSHSSGSSQTQPCDNDPPSRSRSHCHRHSHLRAPNLRRLRPRFGVLRHTPSTRRRLRKRINAFSTSGEPRQAKDKNPP
jgi:hypothetical protein